MRNVSVIQINVIFLRAGLPTPVHGLFGHCITGQGDFIGRGVAERELGHYQQLAYLTSFNRQTGVLSSCWPSVLGWVALSLAPL